MPIADAFIAELTREAAGTRKTLERIPTDRFAWQPHAKSMTLGRLATHTAELLGWMASILPVDEYVMDLPNYKPHTAASTEELLQSFDANLTRAIDCLKGMSDADLERTWRMFIIAQPGAPATPILEMPKVAVVRTMILNHLIHHRGQLTVYLRLSDFPVPALYGPSADER